MSNRKIVIDGFFLTERVTGVQRYGTEIVKQLDKLRHGLDIEIAVPRSYQGNIGLKRIKVKRIGKRTGRMWEQTDLARYLRREKAYPVFFENMLPLLYRKGIIAIHDINLKVNPGFFNQRPRGYISVLWRRLNYFAACRSRMRIITVSAFTKREICAAYHVRPSRVTVVHAAWQHMEDVPGDDTVFLEHPALRKGEYFFSLSSLSRHKNFIWVVNAARSNPGKVFAIAGGGDLKAFMKETGADTLDNILLLGYVSDERARSLMAHCGAFLFPSLYEGFGLPPLEALAVGAKAIVVSDIEVMHEIYGNAAHYIDPYDTRPDLHHIHPVEEAERARLLKEYSFEGSARKLLSLLLEGVGDAHED